ncbi:class I SAM-dependent methyltransferase [Chloroflexota bacterium]
MKNVNTKDIVDQARQQFDNELHTNEYRRIHADEIHLNSLMDLLEILPDKKYMDLGTGNGYLAFEMVNRFPNIQVTGIDIAENSIQQNKKIQQERQIENLEFMAYGGIRLPAIDGSFWGVISRYAFHHFPDPMSSIKEMYRVLEKRGFVIISDPLTYDDDTNDFIDQYQKLKKDGHVHFYRQQELDDLFQLGGFYKEDQFQSEYTYPRELDSRYHRLFEKTSTSILNKYQMNIDETLVYITATVMNVLYRKM